MAAGPGTPGQRLRPAVVWPVPAGVLQQGQGEPAVDRGRAVDGPCHRLVLENSLLPVSQSRPVTALVLQLRPLKTGAGKVQPDLLHHAGRHHQERRLLLQARPDQPRSLDCPDGVVAPLPHLQLPVDLRFPVLQPGRPRPPLLVSEEGEETGGETEGVQEFVFQCGLQAEDVSLLQHSDC